MTQPSGRNLTDGIHQARGYTRAGLPKAVAPAGTSRVTTLPAPISALSAIETPCKTMAPAPIQTLRPMQTGRPNSSPEARPVGSRGVVGRENLYSWPDLGAGADCDFHHIQDHAVEVQEYARAEADVEAVVAVERGPIAAPSPTAAKRSFNSACLSEAAVSSAAL